MKKERSKNRRYQDFYNATTYFPTLKAFAEAMDLNLSTCYRYNSRAVPVPEKKIDYIAKRLKALNLM